MKQLKQQTKVILINGLGRVPKAINLLIKRYKKFGLELSIFEINWHASEQEFEKRFAELSEKLRKLLSEDEAVCLIGYSAGASVVLSALEKFPDLEKVITVNGKILNTQTIGPEYFGPNPSLRASIAKMDRALPRLSSAQKQKVICFKPLIDEVVSVNDAILDGAKVVTKPYIFHTPSIVLSLYTMPRLLKKSLYNV